MSRREPLEAADHTPRSLLPSKILVHPPEEDYLPSICAFDSAHPHRQRPLEVDSDGECIDSGCEVDADIRDTRFWDLLDRDDVVFTSRRRTIDGRPAEDVLAAAEDEYGFSAAEESDLEDSEERIERGNDSEVIEVVKVKRRKATNTEASELPRMPRSQTFMAKASRVFSSFTSKSKPKSSGPVERSTTPTSAGQGLRRSTSLSLGNVLSKNSSNDSDTKRKSSFSSIITRPSADTKSNPHTTEPEPENILPSPSAETLEAIRSTSPTPSAKRSNFRRRMSVLSILPSFSPSPSQTPTPSHSTEPSPQVSSPPTTESERYSGSSASCSSEGTASDSTAPVTPVELDAPRLGEANPGVKVRRSFSFLRKKSEDMHRPSAIVTPTVVAVCPPMQTSTELTPEGDVSVEMKLDSLHFSELSFDAGKF